MNNQTATTTTKLTITSAIYTNSEGISFVIELDPTEVVTAWKYQVTFAGMKVIDNQRSVEEMITQLDAQKSKYIVQIGRLAEAGYKFDNSQDHPDRVLVHPKTSKRRFQLESK